MRTLRKIRMDELKAYPGATWSASATAFAFAFAGCGQALASRDRKSPEQEAGKNACMCPSEALLFGGKKQVAGVWGECGQAIAI
jgi:hypothetical protein